MEVDMGTLTIRLTDDQHQRLKTLAARRGLSLNKLFEEFGTQAIAEFDAETRFALRAARGNTAHGLRLLDRLDTHFEPKRRRARGA
jgi:plasmid stability protein